ncbi:PilN family type IVB pilus formation outer membrane protein [Undibacterium arcticum]|uniref:PilN family type IVB pilus formation outer membrane protein n=1 Tax=Undibacterium arcticum TaxID=1762892 RepID=UPI00361F57FE
MEVRRGEIKIYNVDTETYQLQTIAGGTDMNSVVQSGTTMVNGVSGGSGGGSSGGVSGNSGSSQTTTVSLKTNIWDDVTAAVRSMLSPKGIYATSPATGSITVTDNADALQRVRAYVRKQNEALSKQITFHVQVASVTTNTSDALGISWEAVYKTVAGKYGFSLSNANGAVEGGTSGSFSIVNTSSSPWAGSKAILDALAEQGGVSIIRNPSASTLNLQPVSVQVARQNGFLAGSQNVSTASVGNTTTIQTGIVTTGFNMSLLPYVLEDNRMLLQFSINLSSLRDIRKVSSNGSSAEVPEVDLPINSTQKVRLRAGETLVVSGFDQLDESSLKSGVDSPNNIALGGSIKGSTTKTNLVVLITPEIME